MKIIAKTPGSNGAYPPLQDWTGLVPPEGYYKISDGLDMSAFQAYNGFVTLTTARNVVMDYEPDTEAWEAWKASLPPEPEPEATDTEVINTLLGVSE